LVLEAPDGTQIGAVRSDKDGRFIFPKIPPGKYVLKARSAARGYIRSAATEITVLPPPEKPTEVTLEAR
jgi:hypothetical protein